MPTPPEIPLIRYIAVVVAGLSVIFYILTAIIHLIST